MNTYIILMLFITAFNAGQSLFHKDVKTLRIFAFLGWLVSFLEILDKIQ